MHFRPASLTKDRLLASTLVHSVKKEQEFRSIFDHIKLPQASKSTSESFIQHIVSLVHHVKGMYSVYCTEYTSDNFISACLLSLVQEGFSPLSMMI